MIDHYTCFMIASEDGQGCITLHCGEKYKLQLYTVCCRLEMSNEHQLQVMFTYRYCSLLCRENTSNWKKRERVQQNITGGCCLGQASRNHTMVQVMQLSGGCLRSLNHIMLMKIHKTNPSDNRILKRCNFDWLAVRKEHSLHARSKQQKLDLGSNSI